MSVKNPDLIVGNWRGGLETPDLSDINSAMQRHEAGFRQLPYESTVVLLVRLLDAYDMEAGYAMNERDEAEKAAQDMMKRLEELEANAAVESKVA